MSKDRSYLLIELPLGEGFKEIATGILENTRFYDYYAIYGGFDYIHCFIISLLFRLIRGGFTEKENKESNVPEYRYNAG